MFHKLFTAICLMTMLAVVGCGDAKKTENKTDKTGKEAKTGDDKNDKTMKNDKMNDDDKKTAPTDEGDSKTDEGDSTPTLVPEIDESDDPAPNQETGSAEKSDGPELKME